MNKKIAYLAPDISYPFVYEEIICLQRKKINVIPISLHSSTSRNCSSEINQFPEQTIFIYNRLLVFTFLNIIFYIK